MFGSKVGVAALCLLVGGSAFGHPDGPPKVAADLILVNAKVWTVDRERPEVEGIACWQGRILAVGSTTEMRTLIGPRTQVIDAHGARVVPGFHDSHAHVLGSGLRLGEVALRDAASPAEFGQRIAAFHQGLSRDRWLLGGEWDHDHTFKGRLPTVNDIDPFCPDRPALIRRFDGHMALANTRALQIAGISATSKDLVDGVVRDPKTNEPTGLLRDNAMSLVDKHIPAPTVDAIAQAVQAALKEIRANGVTSVVDMEGSDVATRKSLFRIYQALARTGQLTARIEMRWPIAEWEQLARLAIEADFGNDYLRIGGVKGFIDGSIGSSTAKMFEPFVNEPNSTGLYVTRRETMRKLVEQADRAGLSVAIHAIGDQGNAVMLDIFEEVTKANGPRDRRFRIEHAQHLRPQDYQRFAALNVIASMQPYHVIDDGRFVEGRIGKQRCASSYAYRSLLDAGAKVAFGSDWSVAPISAILGIDAAVNRRTLDGMNPGGWFPAQRITVAEAIEAYTLTSAYAAHQERERGSIMSGKCADFVVLSQDILAPSQRDAIAKTDVIITVVGGKIVFDSRPSDRR